MTAGSFKERTLNVVIITSGELEVLTGVPAMEVMNDASLPLTSPAPDSESTDQF